MGKPDADVNFDKAYGNLSVVHVITGPVGVEGAEPGDKIRIDILDIVPLDKGFTMADTPLGFSSTMTREERTFPVKGRYIYTIILLTNHHHGKYIKTFRRGGRGESRNKNKC